jgi:thiamine biosynthesis lipoprotein
VTLRLRAAALLAGGLAGCGPAATGTPAAAEPYTYQFTAFAAPIRIDILGGDRDRADQAVARIDAFMAAAGRDWYAWGDGELGAVNDALARAGSAELSPTLTAIVGRALALALASGGRFDPTVADLVSLWGFDREERLAVTTAPPPPEVVAAARAAGGALADVTLTGRRITARRPLRLDLGGIAKGSALLRIGAELEAAGIDSALVDLGGSSLLAIGQREDRPWRIGLRHPRQDAIFAGVNLEPGESMATSGDYERFFKSGGRRYGHVIDPRTGAPATGAVSTTVLSTDPELADAAATALLVGGADGFDGLVERLGLTHALLITADGRLLLTPAMSRRLAASNGGRVPPLGWNPAEP